MKYRLYKFPKGIKVNGEELFTKDAYYMIYDDIVPGSDKWYMSGVPESKSVAEAMGWKFSIAPSHWLELKPGLNMN